MGVFAEWHTYRMSKRSCLALIISDQFGIIHRFHKRILLWEILFSSFLQTICSSGFISILFFFYYLDSSDESEAMALAEGFSARLGAWPFPFGSKFLFMLENLDLCNFCHFYFFSLFPHEFSLYFWFSLWWIILFPLKMTDLRVEKHQEKLNWS